MGVLYVSQKLYIRNFVSEMLINYNLKDSYIYKSTFIYSTIFLRIKILFIKVINVE